MIVIYENMLLMLTSMVIRARIDSNCNDHSKIRYDAILFLKWAEEELAPWVMEGQQ